MTTETQKMESPVKVGEKVLIRCVTHYYTGKVEIVTDEEIILSNAAWIADMGRFSEALKNGTLSEVEPYPDGLISINRGAVVDVAPWNHELPRVVK